MTDTTTTRVMARVDDLEATGDRECEADAALLRALAVERDALLKERNALRTGIGVIGVVLDTLRAEVRNG